MTRLDLEVINGLCDEAINELNMIKAKSGLRFMPICSTIDDSIYCAMHDIETDDYYVMRVNKDFTPLDVIFEGDCKSVSEYMIKIIKEGKL